MKINSPTPKSILSLDVGKKRVGLAGCDPLGISIKALEPLIRTSFQEDLQHLKAVCTERRIQGLIIGIPLDQTGGPTKQAIFCEKYGIRLARELCLPLAFVNEHCSTWEAAQISGLTKDKSGRLDSAAAAVLLEQWLREGPELKPVDTASYLAHNLQSDGRS